MEEGVALLTATGALNLVAQPIPISHLRTHHGVSKEGPFQLQSAMPVPTICLSHI